MPIEPAGPTGNAAPSPGLCSLIREARWAQSMLDSERQTSVSDLARRINRRPGFFARIVRLNYLAPDIIAAILDGKQPPSLTRKKLINANLPMDWALQRTMFGFSDRPDHQRGEERY